MPRDTHIHIRIDHKTLVAVLAIAIVCATAYGVMSEKLTVGTSYPSPVGIYKKMITTDQTVLARDTGNVGIGTTAPQAKLDVASTDSGFLPPRMTTEQITAIAEPPEGSIIYDMTSRDLSVFDGKDWTPVSGGGDQGGGGGCYTSYKQTSSQVSCSGDDCCIAGFKNRGYIGDWGWFQAPSGASGFVPPGANYPGTLMGAKKRAHLCCK
ncbi:hypothetical protein ACFL2T_03955 [Elusimicrobiota bacterium]